MPLQSSQSVWSEQVVMVISNGKHSHERLINWRCSSWMAHVCPVNKRPRRYFQWKTNSRAETQRVCMIKRPPPPQKSLTTFMHAYYAVMCQASSSFSSVWSSWWMCGGGCTQSADSSRGACHLTEDRMSFTRLERLFCIEHHFFGFICDRN